jgi:hypothetical protein
MKKYQVSLAISSMNILSIEPFNWTPESTVIQRLTDGQFQAFARVLGPKMNGEQR